MHVLEILFGVEGIVKKIIAENVCLDFENIFMGFQLVKMKVIIFIVSLNIYFIDWFFLFENNN